MARNEKCNYRAVENGLVTQIVIRIKPYVYERLNILEYFRPFDSSPLVFHLLVYLVPRAERFAIFLDIQTRLLANSMLYDDKGNE